MDPDLDGREMPSKAAIRTCPEKMTLALMLRGGRVDWTDWLVNVRDTRDREELLLAFAEVRVSYAQRSDNKLNIR